MTVYLDTSALVKLYLPEPETAALVRYIEARSEALVYTPLHELELRNALRLKLFRREAARAMVSASLRAIAADLSAGVLARTTPDWMDLFARAEELSERFAPRLGARTLDLMHVAAALSHRCRGILTFDARQARVARLAGLRLETVP